MKKVILVLEGISAPARLMGGGIAYLLQQERFVLRPREGEDYLLPRNLTGLLIQLFPYLGNVEITGKGDVRFTLRVEGCEEEEEQLPPLR